MSFREKTTWVTLCAIVIASLLYWHHVPSPFEPSRWALHALGASLAAYLLIEAVAYWVLRWRSPEDAVEPKDERERLIDLAAMRVAYYVFVVGALVGIFVILHLTHAGPVALGMTVLMAFVLAEIVKHLARIAFYRRGV